MKEMYEHKNNGTVAELIEINEKSKMVTLELPDKEPTFCTLSTFKRYWKKIEEVNDVPEDVTEVKEEEVVEEPKVKKEKATKPKKEKKKRDPVTTNPNIEELCEYVFSAVEKVGGEVVNPKNDKSKSRSFKVDGHRFMKFNYNKKVVNLICRGDATSKIQKPQKTSKYMFDSVYEITECDKTSKKLIDQLIKASYDYQVNKSKTEKTKKTTKKTAKKEKK